MGNKKISVIIPAYNEGKFVEKSLRHYRQDRFCDEIIVVVNGSTDTTKEIAEKYADKVLNFPEKIGISCARNEGAKVATGEIFVFSDADSWIAKDGLGKIIEEAKGKKITGTFLGKGSSGTFKEKALFFLRNFLNTMGIHRGVAGILFCSKETFFKIEGFSTAAEPAEQRDFFLKAQKAGAEYKFITTSYAYTSMRRYDQKGYLRMILFWLMWAILWIFRADKDWVKKYYKEKNEHVQ